MKLTPKIIKKLIKKGFTEEQIEFIDKEVYSEFKRINNYNVSCGNKYRVIRKIKGDKNVYYVVIKGKGRLYFHKEVMFCDCEKPNYDEFYIVINQLFENIYYDGNYSRNRLIIKDYKLIENDETIKTDALRKYLKDINSKKDGISFNQLENL